MKALVLLSGGVDSTTCLALAKEKYNDVIALAMYYGQKHSKELESAQKIADYYGVELLKLDLTPVFSYSNCSLLKQSDEAVPQNPMPNRLPSVTAIRFPPMCHSAMACFFQWRQALRWRRGAALFITALTRMTRLAMLTRIAALILIIK